MAVSPKQTVSLMTLMGVSMVVAPAFTLLIPGPLVLPALGAAVLGGLVDPFICRTFFDLVGVPAYAGTGSFRSNVWEAGCHFLMGVLIIAATAFLPRPSGFLPLLGAWIGMCLICACFSRGAGSMVKAMKIYRG